MLYKPFLGIVITGFVVMNNISCVGKDGEDGIDVETAKIESIVSSNDVLYHEPPEEPKLLNVHGNLPTGIPLGNGRFGGILNTTRNQFDLQFNHTDFWRHNPKTKHHTQYGARPFGLAYLKCSWNILFTEYENRLNLYEGTSETNLSTGRDKMKMESFFDMETDLAIFNILPEISERVEFDITLQKWRDKAVVIAENDLIIIYDKPELARSYGEIEYLKELTKDTYQSLYSSQAIGLRVLGGIQELYRNDKGEPVMKIKNSGSENISIVVGAVVIEDTSIMQNIVEDLKSKLESVESIDRLRKSHLKWWKNFWSSSYVQLESADGLAKMYEQIWHMQLYSMASSNRGKYPAKMNGSIWRVDQDERPWGGGYWHFNQNTMHGSLLAANHPDYTLRYVEQLTKNIDLLRKQTKDLWGNKGVFVHETHSPDGLAYQFDRKPIYEKNPKWTSHIFSTTLEIAYQMYQYALYVGDEAYMEEKVFPFFKEACTFYLDRLKSDENESLFMYPSNGHENFWNVKNPQNDLAAIYRCFPILIGLYEKFGKGDGEKEKFVDALRRMSNFPIGKCIRDLDGGPKAPTIRIDSGVDVFAPCEFVDDWATHNVHSVDNYTTYPFELTTIDHPLYEMAKNTIKNSFFAEISSPLMRKMIPSAILHMPEETRELCRQYLENIQMAPSGLAATEPMGDMAITVNYMLLHSFDDIIRIAPSLPKDWDSQFKLLAQGAVVVHAQVKNGSVTYVSLMPKKAQKIRLFNPWKGDARVIGDNGTEFVVNGEVLVWEAEKDVTYKVSSPASEFKFLSLKKRKKNNKVKRFGNKQIGIPKTNLAQWGR
ncbi:glycosyl hydrolase family 95 catalytic domain-containing protein [Flagellimonas sp. 2504JD4-2]